MNLDDLLVFDQTQKRHYTAQRIIDVLDGVDSAAPRATMDAAYQTGSTLPTVYYTALNTDGSILTARTASVSVSAAGDYVYTQDTVGVTDFIAVWDEGDPAQYTSERIAVV